MLLTRITTAIALVVLFLASLFVVSADFFCLSVAVVILIAGWEWASLSEFNSLLSKSIYICLLASVLAVLAFYAGLIFDGSTLISETAFFFGFFWRRLFFGCSLF